jgi:hypothetical protein
MQRSRTLTVVRVVAGAVIGFAVFGVVFVVFFMLPFGSLAAPFIAGVACIGMGMYAFRVLNGDPFALGFGTAGVVGLVFFGWLIV